MIIGEEGLKLQSILECLDTGDGTIPWKVLRAVLISGGTINNNDCERILAMFGKVVISEFLDWFTSSPQDVNKDKEQLEIQRPQGMATKEQVTDTMRARQQRNPEQGTMSW